MTTLPLAGLIADLTRARTITADDVLALRGVVWGGDGLISPDEAQALIALDEAAQDCAPEWAAFYVEALTEFVVRQQQPVGYVDEANAAWMMRSLSRDGRINGDSELETLVHILEVADSTPPNLAAYALEQVKAAAVADGAIGDREVSLLGRILYATGGGGNIAITRAEAEVLLDINDACRGAANDPSWTDLFAKALAASVMTVSGYRAQTRDEALQMWSATPARGNFFGRMAGFLTQPKAMWEAIAFDLNDPLNADAQADQAQWRAAEPVDAAEAAWLMERIGRDGVLDEGEQRVVAFLRQESPAIDPAFQPLLDETPAQPAAAKPFGRRGGA